jgi:hypothetical protein
MSISGTMVMTEENNLDNNLFMKNPKQTGLELKPGLRSSTKPVTNRLSHDTASRWCFLQT